METKGLTPAVGFSITVEDLARFAELQFRDGPAIGNQILKGSTLRGMYRVHWLHSDCSGGLGWGFRIQHKDGRVLVGHRGNFPGYSTELFLCPGDKVAIIVLTNATDGDASIYVDHSVPTACACKRECSGAKT